MQILKFKDYKYFFIGQLISQLGDRIHSLALLWITYKWSGSTAAVGGIMIATTLPGVVISPFAGGLIDRLDKRKIMMFADFFRGILVFFLAFAAYKGFLNYSILISITIFISLASAFFNPSALSIIPELVPSEFLTKANALNQLSGSGSAVLGPLFGSVLIATIGVPTAFLCNAVSFLISMAFIFKINLKSVITKTENFLKDLKDGFAEISANPIIKKLLIPIVVVNFFFSSVVIIVPAIADGVFHMGASGMGYMMSAFGVGMFAGTIFLSYYKKLPENKIVLTLSFMIMGAAFFLMGVMLFFPISLVSLFIAGFCLNVINIVLIVIYQQMLDVKIRGKVMALITATALSLQPVSYGVTGIILDFISPSLMLLISGLVIIGSGYFVWKVKELNTIK